MFIGEGDSNLFKRPELYLTADELEADRLDSYRVDISLRDAQNLRNIGAEILSKEVEPGVSRYDLIKYHEGYERDFQALNHFERQRIFYDFITGYFENVGLELGREVERVSVSLEEMYDLLDGCRDKPEVKAFEETKYVPEDFEGLTELERERLENEAAEIDAEYQDLRPDPSSISNSDWVTLEFPSLGDISGRVTDSERL